MNAMQLFVNIVWANMVFELISHGHELELNRETLVTQLFDDLERMKACQSSGEHFDMAVYNVETIIAITASTNFSAMLDIATDYCLFQSMLISLSRFPDLIARLIYEGLGDWALLQVDRERLRNFMWHVVGVLEGIVAEDNRFPIGKESACAQFLAMAEGVYGFKISEKSTELVNRYFYPDPDLEDEENDEWEAAPTIN